MKINKEELMCMINQIDDDLLYEAAEEYHTSHFGSWKRVIPVAACITLLVLGAAISVLRNITIDRSHEGIEGTVISEHKGDIGKEDTFNDSEESYTIQMNDAEHTITSVLDLITASFDEKGVSERLVVESMEIRLLPKDNTISNGRIALTDMENSTDITVSISQTKIIIDMEPKDTKEEGLENSKTEEQTSPNIISKINWHDFCTAAGYMPKMTESFKDSEYIIVSAELVALLPEVERISADNFMLADGTNMKIIEKEELNELSYSYAFYLHAVIMPGIINQNVLVCVK